MIALLVAFVFNSFLFADFYDQQMSCFNSRLYLYTDVLKGHQACALELRDKWKTLKNPADFENAYLLFERYDPAGIDKFEFMVHVLSRGHRTLCGQDYFQRWLVGEIKANWDKNKISDLLKKCGPQDEAQVFPYFMHPDAEAFKDRLCVLFPKASKCR